MESVLVNMKRYSLYFIVFVFSLMSFLLSGCNDDKLDNIADNRFVTEAMKNSTIRVVNLRGLNQVIANGDSITNFVLRNPEGQDAYKYPGTKYFPKNGKLGKLWYIPQNLFNAQGKVKMKMEMYSYATFISGPIETEFKETDTPLDYYLLQGPSWTSGQPDIVKVPRDISPSFKQDHFKIRLLNLSAKSTSNYSGMEDLIGPMRLTWADGTLVSEKIDNIAPGECSEYIEVPYGTYQFKVLTTDGRQVPGQEPLFVNSFYLLNPQTSTIVTSDNSSVWADTHLTYACIKNFVPGGIYTIVVSSQVFKYPSPGSSEDLEEYQNGFEIIPDIEESPNMSYARLQIVNALPKDGTIGLKLNGKELINSHIKYGDYSDYSPVVKGFYTLSVTDATGGTIAETNIKVDAGSNYSAWIYQTEEGKAVVAVVSNDLSGSSHIDNNGQDDTYNRHNEELYLKMRFFNFTADFKNLTFTTDNGQPFRSLYSYSERSVQQLTSGTISSVSPYVWMNLNILDTYKIMAYRSTPSTIPGTWADEIPVITGTDFILRPELYTRGTPFSDAGVYSVALIGRTTSEGNYKPKMIIVKHTK